MKTFLYNLDGVIKRWPATEIMRQDDVVELHFGGDIGSALCVHTVNTKEDTVSLSRQKRSFPSTDRRTISTQRAILQHFRGRKSVITVAQWSMTGRRIRRHAAGSMSMRRGPRMRLLSICVPTKTSLRGMSKSMPCSFACLPCRTALRTTTTAAAPL